MFDKKCIHEWEKTEKTLPSIADEVIRLAGTMPHGLSPSDFRIHYIILLTCKKCGKIEAKDYWNEAYI